MKFISLIFLIGIFFTSCDRTEKKIKENNNVLKDTIKKPIDISLYKNCLQQIQGYKNRYGITFSNYYKDSFLSFDFDNDKLIDTIIVLKPYHEIDADCFTSNTDFDFPILLISKNVNNISKILKTYANALQCNTPVYYEEISTNKDGFVISKDITGNNGFYTKTYVVFKFNDFYIDSINVQSWGRLQYNKTLKYNAKIFPFSKFKRTDVDSIRNILDEDFDYNKR
ncbi:hypothetical protein L1276_004852 [Flavobacterium sp. HSC-32F16]|uniref:hypothetical protein n=1 Tax=Flavobacterium sp. HSC-32F16 TaxID=2910964 RepID=UPI0020A48178|nr:hypothetical protein [Flavobacterium sp. HSC-32F16]MCP2029658.1 hypothetical protein [Flavobacterium sp. HSC-32F16]